MSKASEAARAEAIRVLKLSQSKKMALDARAEDAWSDAWDATHAADVKSGRRYDRDRYADAARAARIAVYRSAVESAS